MSRSRDRRFGQQVLIAVMVVLTGSTVAFVGFNVRHVGDARAAVQAAQSQAFNVNNADRQALLLFNRVSELGDGVTERDIAIHRGLVERQINIAITSYPQQSASVRELRGVIDELRSFAWDDLQAERGHDDPLHSAVLALAEQTELRLNALRSEQEKIFLSASDAALEADQRREFGLFLLVAVVLALGVSGVTIVLLRGRSELARSEGRFRSLVQRAADLTIVTDEAGMITYVSPAAETLLGHRPTELAGTSLLGHVQPDQRHELDAAIAFLSATPGLVHTIELRLRSGDGCVRIVESVCQNLLTDHDVGGLVWNGRDVTDRRALEEELSHQASHDSLTGLPNRSLLLRRLDEALQVVHSADPNVAVIMVDLDGFKNVNDALGHGAGDELLRIAAKRLLSCVRGDDTAARLGGDEFAVVMPAVSREQALAAGQRIVDVLRRPFRLAGHEVRISASAGLVLRGGTESAEDLLGDADLSMYAAKRAGKARLEVFEDHMRDRMSHRTGLQQELARAVELDEIEVLYQPIVDLTTLRPRSLEALARWRRPDGTLVPTDQLGAVAEEAGVIVEISREVLRQACRAMRRWRTMPGYDDLTVAVNVSVPQVMSGLLVGHVTEALRESGLPGRTLVLEITESAELQRHEQLTTELAQLRVLGVGVTIDDLGSGYSTIGFVTGLDADSLKIDRSLLEYDTTRRGSLVNSLVELGRTLGLTVVVEGVETAEHLNRARQALCDAVQGDHLSPPLSSTEVAQALSRWTEGTTSPARAAAPG